MQYNNLGAVVYNSVGSAQGGKKLKNLFDLPKDKVQEADMKKINEDKEYFKRLGKL